MDSVTDITYTPYTLLMKIWYDMDQNQDPDQDATREYVMTLLEEMQGNQGQAGGGAGADTGCDLMQVNDVSGTEVDLGGGDASE